MVTVESESMRKIDGLMEVVQDGVDVGITAGAGAAFAEPQAESGLAESAKAKVEAMDPFHALARPSVASMPAPPPCQPAPHSSSGHSLSGLSSQATTTKKKKKKPVQQNGIVNGSTDEMSSTKQEEDEGGSSEKTGRWTEEEHARFLHGLERFGKKWTKVADIVGTRTTVQVRSHAQKYFQKLEKDRAAPSSSGVERSNGSGASSSAGCHKSAATTSRPQNGEPAPTQRDDKGRADVSSESVRHRRGSAAASVAVPVALRRFLSPKIVASGRAGAAELAAGLFKFLSPLAIPESDFDQADAATKSSREDSGSTRKGVPDWYRRGGTLQELLDEASDIDWRDDDGGDRLTEATDSDDTESRRKNPVPTVALATPPMAAEDPSVQSASPPLDGDRGSASLTRHSSFEALCTASLAAADSSGAGRKRALSQGSDSLAFDDGLFYDDALYFDEPVPQVTSI